MLYLGHFSFSFKSTARRRKPQPWHGYFTAIAEAPDATAALKTLDALIRKSAASSELLADVSEIFLESCVELRSTPRSGFLAHLALLEGESAGSISTTLPAVSRTHARSYHFEPDTVEADGSFDAEPFIVLTSETTDAPRRAPRPSGRPSPGRTKSR
jgi:hypothetical protein